MKTPTVLQFLLVFIPITVLLLPIAGDWTSASGPEHSDLAVSFPTFYTEMRDALDRDTRIYQCTSRQVGMI